MHFCDSEPGKPQHQAPHHEHVRSSDSCNSVRRGLRALTNHADMGLGAMVSSAEAPNCNGNSISARIHPRLSIGSARGFGDVVLPDAWRVPLLRSAPNENLRCRRSAIAWRACLRGRWSVASEFFAMACSCFGDCDTCLLGRSGNRGMTRCLAAEEAELFPCASGLIWYAV